MSEERFDEIREWRREMDALHREVIDGLQAIRDDDGLRQEMRAGFAMIMKRLDDLAITSLERTPS